MSLLQMSFAGAVMILAITMIRALSINLLPKNGKKFSKKSKMARFYYLILLRMK